MSARFVLHNNKNLDAEYAITVKHSFNNKDIFDNVYHFYKNNKTSIFNNKGAVLDNKQVYENNEIAKKLFEKKLTLTKTVLINQMRFDADKILSNNVQHFSNLKLAPLYKLEFIYNLFLESKLTVNKFVTQSSESNKVLGFLVENDKGKIFVPTLPSGLLGDKDKLVSIENIDESELMGYTDAVNTLKGGYIKILIIVKMML